jgi:hypothetical protein
LEDYKEERIQKRKRGEGGEVMKKEGRKTHSEVSPVLWCFGASRVKKPTKDPRRKRC